MPLHGLSVAAGQDKARTDTARGTDGTKDIGRLRALVPERRGSAAASRPAPGEHGFLADPGLILPPNFYRGVGREPGSDLPQPGGEVFLKSSTANSFCPCGVVAPISCETPAPSIHGPPSSHQPKCGTLRISNAPGPFGANARHRGSPESDRSSSRASACRCLSLSLAGLPVALPSIRPSGPLALRNGEPSHGPPGARQYRSAPPPCDGHHRKSQPARSRRLCPHPSTPWLTAEAPDHQNLP